MALFDRKALNPGVSWREIFAWALFDAANSGYSTVVVTAIFNVYFVSVICQGASWSTFLWTCAMACGNALSIFLMPAIGRLADLRAQKKRWLILATLLCVTATALLAMTGPGTLVLAVGLIVLSLLGFNVGETLNSAFLPELARSDAVGKVSGWGWGLGYFGGLFSLGVALLVIQGGTGINIDMDTLVGASNVTTAIIFLGLSIPVFLMLKERAKPQVAHITWYQAYLDGTAQLREMGHSLKDFPDFSRLVVCGFFYQCGIATVIALATIYASEVMHFTMTQNIIMVLVVNITAAIGAFAFGYIQDALGHKVALGLTLVLWLGMVGTAAMATDVTIFWIAANLAGLAMGSSQSAGRAMVAIFAPESRLAQFYSFWNMALWVSAIVGPMSYGAVTWLTGNNHRIAILVTGIFFLLGLFMLLRINIERGRTCAQNVA